MICKKHDFRYDFEFNHSFCKKCGIAQMIAEKWPDSRITYNGDYT